MLASGLVAAWPGEAAAQEAPSGVNAVVPVAAPGHEVGATFGYDQGFGNVRPGTPLSSFAGAGAAMELDLGMRPTPAMMFGLYAKGALYNVAGDVPGGISVTGAAFGVQARAHFRPTTALDPWFGLGAGALGNWVRAESGTTSRLGLELVRVQLGVDIHTTPNFAGGPFVGTSLDMYMWERGPEQPRFVGISGRVSTSVFIGFSAHFDLGG